MSIRQARERIGLSQIELAQAVGVSQGAISQWEKGLTHPSFKVLRTLARVLNTTIDEIVGEESA